MTQRANRVTDFTTSKLEIDEEEFYRLPEKTQELIRSYAFNGRRESARLIFDIASYRLSEIFPADFLKELEENAE